MDAYKRISNDTYGECNYCDYLTCCKNRRGYNKRKPCKIRREELKSKTMKCRIRQKLKKELDFMHQNTL